MASIAKTWIGPKLRDGLLWAGFATIVVAFTAYGYVSNKYYRDHAVRSDNGCLAYAGTPATVVIINDATDKLAGDQPRRWRATINDVIGEQPPGSSISFTQIGPTVPTELKFAPVLCVPPVGTAARQKILQSQFASSISDVEKGLEAASTTARSAISDTILAAALDPSVLKLGHKEFVVESDLLENTTQTSAYRHKHFDLPPVIGTPFKNMTIRFVVLRNDRDARYQTRQLIQAWVAWARAGGVTVEVDAPWLGFVLPARSAGPEESK